MRTFRILLLERGVVKRNRSRGRLEEPECAEKVQKLSPRPSGEGSGLVCVVKVCASKLWFAGYHDS